MDGWKTSPFYKTLSPIGAAAQKWKTHVSDLSMRIFGSRNHISNRDRLGILKVVGCLEVREPFGNMISNIKGSGSNIGDSGVSLGTRGAILATQGTLLPTQEAILTTQGAVLATQGAVLATQGAVLATQGAVLVIQGT